MQYAFSISHAVEFECLTNMKRASIVAVEGSLAHTAHIAMPILAARGMTDQTAAYVSSHISNPVTPRLR